MHTAAPWLILLFSASSSTTKFTSFNFFFCCLICVCICFVYSEPNVRAEDLYRTGTVIGPKSTQHMFFFIRLKPMEHSHPIAIVCLFPLHFFHPMQKSIDLRSVSRVESIFRQFITFQELASLTTHPMSELKIFIVPVPWWDQSRPSICSSLYVSSRWNI